MCRFSILNYKVFELNFTYLIYLPCTQVPTYITRPDTLFII